MDTGFRYGDCAAPGAAYFFSRTRIQKGERKPPSHCEAFTVAGDPYNQCVVGTMDTYFKVSAPIPGRFYSCRVLEDGLERGFGTAAEAELAARAACVDSCKVAYTPAPWDPPSEGGEA